MRKPVYKLRFIKRSLWGLVRNLHRNSDMIIIYKERYNVLYTKYKNTWVAKWFSKCFYGKCGAILKMLAHWVRILQLHRFIRIGIYSFLWRIYTAKTARGVAAHGVVVGYAVRVCRRSRLHWHPPTARRLWEPAEHRLPHTPCEIATGMSHTQDF